MPKLPERAAHLDAQWVTKTRRALRKAGIEERLMQHYLGEIELTQSQVMVGLSLLDRVLPKLSQQTLEVKAERKDYRNMSREELDLALNQIVERVREGATLQ